MNRILAAFLITVVGLGFSFYFLRPGEWGVHDSKNASVVARILELKNDVNRQGEGRLLWSPLRKGDEIYLGDKIKTSGLSSAVIQFTASASKLEVEENSMIVMAKEGKKLALNMLEGRVFVKQGEGELDLLSQGKKLDLRGNAAISVSKNGSQVESFGENFFGELLPQYSQNIMSNSNSITLSWKPSGYEGIVEVMVGESPVLMKKIQNLSENFTAGKLDVSMRPGVNYWQLVTSTPQGLKKSPLMKLNLERPLPPTPLFPSDKEIVRASEKAFDFKWTKGNAGDGVVVEVARDAAFTQLVFSKEIKDQTFYAPPSNLSQGEYFWRVKSKINNNEWAESKIQSFAVHLGSGLISPALLFPADNSVVYIPRTSSAPVKFEWRKQENVKSYQLLIEGENFRHENDFSSNSATVSIGRAGRYTWEVISTGADGKPSVLPVKRKFEVRQTANIQWLMTQKTFLYLDQKPIVVLRWEKRVPGVSILKISSNQDMSSAESFQVQGNDFPYRVLNEGVYFSKVVTLDESGQSAAESDVFDFTVQEAPLPVAPILSLKQKLLKASAQGDFSASVTNRKQPWLVIATLMDSNGRTVDERRFPDDRISFSGMMPGKYVLQMKFQDEYRRDGELSERLDLEVPEKSMIAAPKVKGIKVR